MTRDMVETWIALLVHAGMAYQAGQCSAQELERRKEAARQAWASNR